jgi:hypothetical protein
MRCIHIEYVLSSQLKTMGSHAATTTSPTNQSCATRNGASSCVGAARAALAARGRREPCRGRSWTSRGHTGRAAHEGSSATLRTREEPTGEAAAGPCDGALGRGASRPRWLAASHAGCAPHFGRAGPPRWLRRLATPCHQAGWPRPRAGWQWPSGARRRPARAAPGCHADGLRRSSSHEMACRPQPL